MEVTYNIELELIEETSENEALASIVKNPSVTFCKFILTDDLPNLNKQRVPVEEFASLITSGFLMPLKMAAGEIKDDHKDALPLGVISHLKQVNNQVQGLAALWNRERPEDVKLIKERYANKQPLQLSWEILYDGSTINEDGIEDLHGVNLRAVTLVGMPAYSGRTPIVAVASENNSIVEEKKLELEQLQAELESTKASLTAKEEQLTAMATELEQLREFKSAVDKVQADAEKLASIKQKFVEAGLEKPDEYFVEKRDMLFAMSSEALDFMIQELVSFAALAATKIESTSSTKVPPLVSKQVSVPTNSDLVQFLRTNKQK
jgi:hypothetical protein